MLIFGENKGRNMNTKLFFALIFTFIFIGCPDDEECTNCPTPIDTTSHAFTWQTFTWGGGGASSINDIAIISDTNIWAVGSISLPDSIAQDSLGHNPPFGAAHWDGKDWKLFRLPVIVSPTYTTYLAPTGIIAFSITDIWLASGGVHRFNGTEITHSYWLAAWPGNPQTPILTEEQRIEKLWGSSSSNLYAVGRKGGIAHYNGSIWQKVESGTTFNFQDIYGAQNTRTGGWEIYALATQYDTLPVQTQLLRIQGTTTTKIETFSTLYFSVWFVPGEKYFLSGDGILWKNNLSDASWTNNPKGTITNNTSGCIRGNNLNDFFVSQLYLDLIHYNGSTWHDYVNEIPGGFGTYPRIALQGNTIVAGGWINQDATLLLGKR
jgi:hypothetical protein